MKKPVLYFICLVLVMLVTGVFWGTWFTLTRSLDTFPPDNFIRIGKTIISNVAWPMRILMPVTLATLLGLCFLTSRPSLYYFAAALLLMAVTLIITVTVEVPIDNLINTWTVDTIPDNWTALRNKWGVFHSMRTFTSILSFVCLAIGIVIDKHRSKTIY